MKKTKQIILIVLVTLSTNKIFAQDSLRFFPNPFSDSTLISFDIAQASKVSIFIYNLIGQEVGPKFSDTFLQPGTHSIFFGATLPKAVYIVKYLAASKEKLYKISKSDPISSINHKITPVNEVLVYPNPANGFVNIKISEILNKSGKVNILDKTGRLIYTGNYYHNNIEINLSEMDAGIYTINIPELNYYEKLILIK